MNRLYLKRFVMIHIKATFGKQPKVCDILVLCRSTASDRVQWQHWCEGKKKKKKKKKNPTWIADVLIFLNSISID